MGGRGTRWGNDFKVGRGTLRRASKLLHTGTKLWGKRGERVNINKRWKSDNRQVETRWRERGIRGNLGKREEEGQGGREASWACSAKGAIEVTNGGNRGDNGER